MNESDKKDREEHFNKADLTKEAVFADLYDYYGPMLLRHALFRLNGSEEARDVVSQVFLKTWQYLGRQNPKPKIKNTKAFLYQLANNLVIDIYRQKGKQTLPLETTDSEAVFADYKAAARQENLFDIEQAFKLASGLREDYRQVISLRYLDGLSIGEIAQILDRSRGSVSVLLFRATKEMRRLTNEFEK